MSCLNLRLLIKLLYLRLTNIIHPIQKLYHGAFPNDFHKRAKGFLGSDTDGFNGIGEEFCTGFADDLSFLFCGGKRGCSETSDEEFQGFGFYLGVFVFEALLHFVENVGEADLPL